MRHGVFLPVYGRLALYSGMGVACRHLSCLIDVSRLRGADLRGLDWVSADLIR